MNAHQLLTLLRSTVGMPKKANGFWIYDEFGLDSTHKKVVKELIERKEEGEKAEVLSLLILGNIGPKDDLK